MIDPRCRFIGSGGFCVLFYCGIGWRQIAAPTLWGCSAVPQPSLLREGAFRRKADGLIQISMAQCISAVRSGGKTQFSPTTDLMD